MILNNIPVLDKGYVALHSRSMSGKEFKQALGDFNTTINRLSSVVSINIVVKCPLFVQMVFPEYGMSYITQKAYKVEAFIPTVDQVNAISLEASEAIQKDIEQTTNALIINPTAYQSEHCDIFISQVISPISIYNTILVTGPLSSWISLISKTGMPSAIEAYRKAIEDIIYSEYPDLRLKK